MSPSSDFIPRRFLSLLCLLLHLSFSTFGEHRVLLFFFLLSFATFTFRFKRFFVYPTFNVLLTMVEGGEVWIICFLAPATSFIRTLAAGTHSLYNLPALSIFGNVKNPKNNGMWPGQPYLDVLRQKWPFMTLSLLVFALA